VSDLVRVSGTGDVWELRFQHGIAGETDARIEYQGQSVRDQGSETCGIPFSKARNRSPSSSPCAPAGGWSWMRPLPPRGWERLDWGAVPAQLQDRGDRSVPALCFRVAEPEGPLSVAVRRHDLADEVKVRVTKADMTTLFSPRGPSLTAAHLSVEVVEKSPCTSASPTARNCSTSS